MSTAFFGIRQISTGYFMPNYGSRRGRGGWTNDEPQPLLKHPPRLFIAKHRAERALKMWLKGVTKVSIEVFNTLDGPEPEENWSIIPVPHREANDMEIVAVILSAWRLTPSGTLRCEVPK